MSKKLFSNHKKMNILWTIAIIMVALFLIWVAFGYLGSRVETLYYTVLSSDKEYEIRELHEHIIAETTVSGNFDDTSGEAFNILAGYIFGKNNKKQAISMTSPVIENESENIAMTAPVVEQDEGKYKKIFSFVMPAEYTMETLPKPLDKRITTLSWAGYNPPWTPPFMRRLEVWAQLSAFKNSSF